MTNEKNQTNQTADQTAQTSEAMQTVAVPASVPAEAKPKKSRKVKAEAKAKAEAKKQAKAKQEADKKLADVVDNAKNSVPAEIDEVESYKPNSEYKKFTSAKTVNDNIPQSEYADDVRKIGELWQKLNAVYFNNKVQGIPLITLAKPPHGESNEFLTIPKTMVHQSSGIERFQLFINPDILHDIRQVADALMHNLIHFAMAIDVNIPRYHNKAYAKYANEHGCKVSCRSKNEGYSIVEITEEAYKKIATYCKGVKFNYVGTGVNTPSVKNKDKKPSTTTYISPCGKHIVVSRENDLVMFSKVSGKHQPWRIASEADLQQYKANKAAEKAQNPMPGTKQNLVK